MNTEGLTMRQPGPALNAGTHSTSSAAAVGDPAARRLHLFVLVAGLLWLIFWYRDTFMAMVRLPPSANVLFMTVMATNMPFVGRG